MKTIKYHPSLEALREAVLVVLDRCSRTSTCFTHKSVCETIHLDHPKWIFVATDIEIIIYELFIQNKIKGFVESKIKTCKCKENCFCMPDSVEVSYKRKTITDGTGVYYKYYLESN